MTSANRNLTWKLGIQDNASSGFSKVADNSESMGSRISGAFSKVANAVGGEVGELIQKAGDGFEKIGDAGTGAWTKIAAGGAVVAGIGVALQSFASKGEQAEAQLKQAIDNTGESFSDYEAQISKAEAGGAKFGDTNGDVANALQTLVQATGDTATALADLDVAYDLAAAKHISLGDAATMLAKIYGGSTKGLKQFGVDMTVTAGNTQEATAAIQQLAAVVNGQADASVDNFSGRVTEARTRLEDWAETAAGKVGPALTYIGTGATIVSGVIDVFAARAQKAAASELELAAANEKEGASAAESAVGNAEAATSADALAASSDRASASALGSKAASLGAVAGLGAFAAAAYYTGGAISSALESSNDLAHVMDQSGSDLKNFTAALEADNGAIGDNAKQSVLASLSAAGLNKQNRTSVVTLSDMANAVMDNDTEFNKLIGTWLKGKDINQNQAVALKLLHDEFEKGQLDAQQYQTALTNLGAASTTTYVQLAAVNGPVEAIAAGVASMGNSISDVTPDMDTFDSVLAKLGGNALSSQQASDSFMDSVDSVTASVKTNGRSLDDSTTKGRANEEAVLSAISAADAHAQAVYKQTNSVQAASTALNQDEKSLLSNATQAGLTKGKVQDLINTYAAVPTNITTTMEFDDSAALNNVHDADSEFKILAGLWQSDPLTAAAVQDQVNFNARAGYVAGGQAFAAAGMQLGTWGGGVTVGEHGREFIDSKGYVHPHGQTEQMIRNSSGETHTHYHVNVSMPAVVQPTPDAARVIAAHLEAWVRQGGQLKIARGVN